MRRFGQRGFTLVELMITITIFSVLSYALLSALGLSTSSREAVSSMADQNETLRDAVNAVADDLRISSEARVVLVELADDSTQVTLQLPLAVGGGVAWGVPAEDAALVGGVDQAGWFLRYEIVAGGDGVRRLVRRVLDDGGNQIRSTTVAEGLSDGAGGAAPGLVVAQTGDVWEITVTLEGGRRSQTTNVSPRN